MGDPAPAVTSEGESFERSRGWGILMGLTPCEKRTKSFLYHMWAQQEGQKSGSGSQTAGLGFQVSMTENQCLPLFFTAVWQDWDISVFGPQWNSLTWTVEKHEPTTAARVNPRHLLKTALTLSLGLGCLYSWTTPTQHEPSYLETDLGPSL